MDIKRNWSRYAAGTLIGLAVAGCASEPKQATPATKPPPTVTRPPAARVTTPPATKQTTVITPATKTVVTPATNSTEGTVILCSAESVTRILAGNQTSTTRKGVRTYPLGPATLESGKRRIAVEITQLKHAKFADLTDAEARSGGLASLEELKTALQASYPDVQDSDEMTTIHFRLKP